MRGIGVGDDKLNRLILLGGRRTSQILLAVLLFAARADDVMEAALARLFVPGVGATLEDVTLAVAVFQRVPPSDLKKMYFFLLCNFQRF